MLQTLNNRSLTEPVPSIPEGFEMTVWLVFGQTLNTLIDSIGHLPGENQIYGTRIGRFGRIITENPSDPFESV
jgi:hypothetical protein